MNNENLGLENNKKKGNGLVVLFGILFVITLGLGVFGFIKHMDSPSSNAIHSVFKTFRKGKFTEGTKSVKADISFVAKDDSLKDLNKISFSIETSSDMDKAISFIKFGLLSDNKDVLDFSTLLKDNKAYVKSEKLTDKILYYDYSEMVKTELSKEDKDYLVDIIEKAVINAFKDEKVNKEDVKLRINGKEESVKNNYYVYGKDNSKRINNNIFSTLDDDKFIDIVAKMTGEEKAEIKKSITEMKDSDDMIFSEGTKICFYTKGLLQTNIGVSIEEKNTVISYIVDGDYSIMNADLYGATFTAETIKDVTTAKLVVDKKEVFTAKITEKDNKYDVDADIVDYLNIKAKIEYNDKASISEFDTSNAVSIDKLSSEDMEKIYTNLEKVLTDSGLMDSLGSSLGTGTNLNNQTDVVVNQTDNFTIEPAEGVTVIEDTTDDDSFVTKAKNVYKSAQTQWIIDNVAESVEETIYSNDVKPLKDVTDTSLKYEIKINKTGLVTSYKISNDEYSYDSGEATNVLLLDITEESIKKRE